MLQFITHYIVTARRDIIEIMSPSGARDIILSNLTSKAIITFILSIRARMKNNSDINIKYNFSIVLSYCSAIILFIPLCRGLIK